MISIVKIYVHGELKMHGNPESDNTLGDNSEVRQWIKVMLTNK